MTTTSERWFQRVVWVGIIANVALAVPTLLWPSEMLAFSRLPDAVPPVWVRFSSLLLILLSSFYVPAAGVLFFMSQARDYWLFAAFDFAFFLPQALLLLRAASRAGG